jgi:hypothetical protein
VKLLGISVVACFALSVLLIWRYDAPHVDHQCETSARDTSTEMRLAWSTEVIYKACWPSLPNIHHMWLLMNMFFTFIFFVVHNIVVISQDRP